MQSRGAIKGIDNAPQIHQHTLSKCKGCPFTAYTVQKKKNSMGWVLIITNPDHNHAAEEPQAHSIHWQNGLSIELLDDLQQSCDSILSKTPHGNHEQHHQIAYTE